MTSNKRFIEETFPVKEVSVESAKEKSIRHGHISTLHIWWARRPLASSRATSYAALIPAPSDIEEWNKKRQFIIDFSKWENSLNQGMIKQAREDILKANGGKPPRVLDPFAGGGAIPLEALRLGCEVHASDYNPVATFILKCTIEYPQKYGRLETIQVKETLDGQKMVNPLLEDVKKYGQWVLKEVTEEIGQFYPVEADSSTPVCYLWARSIPCQNPSCGVSVPLIHQLLLAKKGKNEISLYPFVEKGELKFQIVGQNKTSIPSGFKPETGTVSKAIATCPVCKAPIDGKTIKKLFVENKSSQNLIAVVTHKKGEQGKRYRIATEKDLELFNKVTSVLEKKRGQFEQKWGFDPIPDEFINPKNPEVELISTRCIKYGLKKYSDLFNNRQLLSLVTFIDKVRECYKKMLDEGYEENYAKVIMSYLAMAIDRLADFGSSLCMLNPTGGRGVVHTFGRQSFPMVWDYAESNPFLLEGAGWTTACEKNEKWIAHSSQIDLKTITINQISATILPYPDNHFDAVFTDPPYYDNINYAELSDFFYVWLKRTIGDLYPDLFSTPLVPKTNEIVANSLRQGSNQKAKEFFESNLSKSFHEICRVLKLKGIVTIVYAHKSTSGWEALINSLLDSGLVVNSAWPVSTEKKGRLVAIESAALASSIYIVARKMQRQSTGFYNETKEEIKQHLGKKLERLWTEGVIGADFFVAAIGSAIEVFGKYEKVMDYEGNIVRADRLLDDVREIATDYAVHQILHDGFAGEITDITRFYVLWRWNYGAAKVPFDEARKLAQSCGIDLANEWNRQRFVKKENEFIRVLGPQERQLDELRNSAELIDVLHAVLLLWEKSNRSEMVNLLQKSGYGKGEVFYRVAQAISETLPIESKEKKLLDGFLAGRERLREEIKKEAEQRKLL